MKIENTNGAVIDLENPYEDYELFEIEVKEISTRNIVVYAKDAKLAEEYVKDVIDEIKFAGYTDKYERVVGLVTPLGYEDVDIFNEPDYVVD